MKLLNKIKIILLISLLIPCLKAQNFYIPEIGTLSFNQKINRPKIEEKLGLKIRQDFIYQTKIYQSVPYKDTIISNIDAIYSPKSSSIVLIGEAEIFNIKTKVTLTLKQINEIWVPTKFRGYTHSISAGSLFNDPKISWALSNVEIVKTKVFYNLEKNHFEFSGEAKLFGTLVDINFYRTNNNNENSILLTAKAKSKWHPSNIFPSLKNTIIDNLSYSNLQFTISAITQNDNVLGIDTKAGIYIDTRIKIDKSLQVIDDLMTVNIEEIDLHGELNLHNQQLFFSTELPGVIKFQKGPIKSGSVRLQLDVMPVPRLRFLTNIKVETPNNSHLNFIAQINTTADGLNIAGTMEGIWHNALGINGLNIGNLGITAGAAYATISEGIPITNLGVTGQVDIGRVSVPLAIILGVNPEKTLIYGAISQLTLEDLVLFAQKICPIHLPNLDVPNIGFKDMRIYFSLNGGKINGFEFPQGISLSGTGMLLGKEAGVNISLGTLYGITLEGWLPEINICNHLKITAAKTENPIQYPGPIFSLNINPIKQECLLSGCFDILGIAQNGQANITKDGIKLHIDGKLLNLCDSSLDCHLNVPIFNSENELEAYLNGMVNILGKQGLLEVLLNNETVQTKGVLPKITFPLSLPGIGPVFEINALDENNNSNMGHDGPYLNLNLSDDKKELILNGSLKLLGSSSNSKISISENGYSFHFNNKLFNLFDCELLGIGSTSNGSIFPEIQLEGNVGFLGKNGYGKMLLSNNCILSEGVLPLITIPSPIPNFPLLKLSNPNSNDSNIGPNFYLNLSPQIQDISIEGKVDILGISQNTTIKISPNGELFFQTTGKLKGLLSSSLEVYGPKPEHPINNIFDCTNWINNFFAQATLTNDFQNLLENKILDELEENIAKDPSVMTKFAFYENQELDLTKNPFNPRHIAQKILASTPLIINEAILKGKLSEYYSTSGPTLTLSISIYSNKETIEKHFSLYNPAWSASKIAFAIAKKILYKN